MKDRGAIKNIIPIIGIILTSLSILWGISQTIYAYKMESQFSQFSKWNEDILTNKENISSNIKNIEEIKIEQTRINSSFGKDIEYIKDTLTEIKKKMDTYLKLSELGGSP